MVEVVPPGERDGVGRRDVDERDQDAGDDHVGTMPEMSDLFTKPLP
jgi:hypothetical protein